MVYRNLKSGYRTNATIRKVVAPGQVNGTPTILEFKSVKQTIARI